MIEERGKQIFVAAEGLFFGELLHRVDQLGDVFPPGVVFFVFGIELLQITRFVEHQTQQCRQRRPFGFAAQLFDQQAEAAQGGQGAAREREVERAVVAQGFPGAAAVLQGQTFERVLGGFSDAPRRHVEHPGEGERIFRPAQEAQVGQDVLDFGPLVKTGAGHQVIRQAAAQQLFFDGAGLRVGAHQHRHASPAASFFVRDQRLHQKTRFFLLVARAVEHQLFAGTGIGPQIFAAPLFVARHHRAGGVEDVLRRTVVALELAHLRTREVALEFEDVFELGAAPAVDALVLVAHRGDAAGFSHQLTDQRQLGEVGVLEFVDQEPAGLFLHAAADGFVAGEQLPGEADHVVEIDTARIAQQVLVVVVDLGDLTRPEIVGRTLVFRRTEQLVFGAADAAQNRLWFEVVLGNPGEARGLFDQRKLIRAVEDGEVRPQVDLFAIGPQEAQGEPVEGAHKGRQRVQAKQHLHPLAHFRGGLVGEGQGGDAVRGDAFFLHQPGDAVGDRAGFARAGPGQDELGLLAMGCRGQLFFVQFRRKIDAPPHPLSLHSTVTLLARLRGWSTSQPSRTPMW